MNKIQSMLMEEIPEELAERMVKLAEKANAGEVINADFADQIVVELVELMIQNAEATRTFAAAVRATMGGMHNESDAGT